MQLSVSGLEGGSIHHQHSMGGGPAPPLDEQIVADTILDNDDDEVVDHGSSTPSPTSTMAAAGHKDQLMQLDGSAGRAVAETWQSSSPEDSPRSGSPSLVTHTNPPSIRSASSDQLSVSKVSPKKTLFC